ncbi:MAG: hypothetical protein II359_02810, partial [Clostridia bacterium]|nr:hypothetical protein [Clostridia bacterium]
IAVLFMLFFKADYDAISTGKVANKKVLCAVFAVLFLAVGVKQYVALFMETKSLTEKNEIILYAKENSDIHMTATAWTRNHLYARRIHLLTKNIEEHVIHSPFGDWFSYFPYYYARMEKIGMGDYTNNALLMLTEDEQCRFLASDQKEIPMLITYFKEHYGKDVEAVCLQSFLDGEFKLYRFYIVENNNESRKGS